MKSFITQLGAEGVRVLLAGKIRLKSPAVIRIIKNCPSLILNPIPDPPKVILELYVLQDL